MYFIYLFDHLHSPSLTFSLTRFPSFNDSLVHSHLLITFADLSHIFTNLTRVIKIREKHRYFHICSLILAITPVIHIYTCTSEHINLMCIDLSVYPVLRIRTAEDGVCHRYDSITAVDDEVVVGTAYNAVCNGVVWSLEIEGKVSKRYSS